MATAADLPSNVPQDRVVDFDIYDFAIKDGDYACTLKSLTKPDLADVLWTPHHGGLWIVTRAAGIETILRNPNIFSSVTAGPPEPRMEQPQQGKCPFAFMNRFRTRPRIDPDLTDAPLVPLQLDAPEHLKYRRLIADAFTPSALAPILAETRAFAIALIEDIRGRGECEFFDAFALQVPATTFMKLIGLPLIDRDFLVQTSQASLHGSKIETQAASRKLVAYGMQKIKERRAAPGQDLVSAIAVAQIDGKPLDDATLAGMMRLLLLAGFDTVSSMLGFFAHFLANNPAQRHELVNHPELIPKATEELLRRFANVMLTRLVKQDFDYGGVTLRKGQMVAVPTALAGLDERKVENPLKVDLSRPNLDHAAFGDGPHRCLGASLAQGELIIFLEEWLKRIPDFEVKSGAEIKVITNGALATITSLPLCWKVS